MTGIIRLPLSPAPPGPPQRAIGDKSESREREREEEIRGEVCEGGDKEGQAEMVPLSGEKMRSLLKEPDGRNLQKKDDQGGD